MYNILSKCSMLIDVYVVVNGAARTDLAYVEGAQDIKFVHSVTY